jgi:signal transduction histidine kinase
VAHDLRNPITAILGLTDLLSNSPNESNHYINLINRSCNNALSIIVDLLDITELGNENYTLSTNTIELNTLINDILVIENHNAINKNITINFNTNRDDIFVRVNNDKFSRVISNLISNAVKFSHSNSSILITTQYITESILIKVADNGIGIPKQMQEVIFDKFTKAGRKGTAGEKSFGLGMSIVKQIVELHGGKIWLESEENKGTTVFIELKSAI